MEAIWPEIIEGDRLLARNGRWGTCGFCPRTETDVFPERCAHTDRYDHRLGQAQFEAMCGRWVQRLIAGGAS